MIASFPRSAVIVAVGMAITLASAPAAACGASGEDSGGCCAPAVASLEPATAPATDSGGAAFAPGMPAGGAPTPCCPGGCRHCSLPCCGGSAKLRPTVPATAPCDAPTDLGPLPTRALSSRLAAGDLDHPPRH